MKEENNIQDFFKNRLNPTTVEEDTWNIPSDDIWEKAKPHFPKKKKRRSLFFLLFSVLGLLILSTISIYYLSKHTFESKLINEQTLATTDKENIESNNQEKLLSSQKLHEEITTQSLTDNPNLSSANDFKSKQKESAEMAVKTTSKITSANKPPVPANTDKAAEETSSKSSTNFGSTLVKSNISPSNNSISNIATSNNALSNSSLNDSSLGNTTTINENSTGNLKEGIELAQSNNENYLQEEISTEVDVALDFPKLSNSIANLTFTPLNPVDADAFKIIKPANSFSHWEIGISHAPFITFPSSIFESDSTDTEEVNVDIQVNYRNLNIPISYRFNERFSLSSGMYFSSLNSQLKFTDSEIYDDANSDNNLNNLIKSRTSGGSITLDNESQEINIQYIPGANLMNGDNLTVIGNLPLNLTVIQVPIIFNYHLRSGQFEYSAHLGFSIDFYSASVKSVDLRVYKENSLISEPIAWKPLSMSAFGPGIYSGVGMKYHLTKHINLGLTTKLDLVTPTLSRYEIGFHYRL